MRILVLLSGIAIGATAAAQAPSPASDPCAGDPDCRHASAGELFAAADALVQEGKLADAEALLVVLTDDPNPDLRAEARFRLAAVREQRGNLAGAAAALRALLADKPDAQRARLELSRILALQGDKVAASRELKRARSGRLPADVARTVRQFSSALEQSKRRGASVDVAAALDSNVNRSTSSRFVDTVIAPFELDPTARQQSGVGLGFGGEVYSRDDLLGTTLQTRAGLHADLFAGKSRFNDIQLAVTSGPELSTGIGQFRPAVTLEGRWYGGKVYSHGYGGSLNWFASLGKRSQFQLDGSVAHQAIRNNPFLDGTRYLLAATYDRALSQDTSARLIIRGAALDAKARPESLRQGGGDALIAHSLAGATVFAQAGYTRTDGLVPIALFGRTRHDDRLDLGAGIVADAVDVAGFSPVVRFLYTRSSSNLALYDYRRARLELGLTRSF